MNTDQPAHQHRVVAQAAVAAALLGAMALLTACGSKSSGETATGQAVADQARQYAQCIRDNGVPDFPDPDANGQFSGAGHELQSDPSFQAASEACRALAPGGEHEQAIGTPAFVEQARAFAQCIRENGVPDFPDPGPDGTFTGASHEQGDPRFEAAMKACQSKLPGGAHQAP